MKSARLRQFVALLAMNLMGFQQVVQAATIDLATSPLANSTTDVVRPNLMYVLDDSGSMAWEYTPDYINDSGNSAMCWKIYTSTPYLRDTALSDLSTTCAGSLNSSSGNDIPFTTPQLNYQYYDPAIYYKPPVKADGTSYPNASTSAPKADGFLSTSGTSNLLTTGWKHTVWCNTNSPSPTPSASNIATHAQCKENANSAGSVLYPDNTYIYRFTYDAAPFYYTLHPWEYCADSALTDCIFSTAPSGAYTLPSTLRWCTAFDGDKKYTGCQGRWDASHIIPKYLGYVATKSYGSITITDATVGRRIDQVTIHGNNLLTTGSPVNATGSISTTAQALCNAIKTGPSNSIYEVRSGSTSWDTCNSAASGLVEIRRRTADATDNGYPILLSGPGYSPGTQAYGTITISAVIPTSSHPVQVDDITAGGASILTVKPQIFDSGNENNIAAALAPLIGNGFTATASGNVITITKNTVGADTGALVLVAPGARATATITVGSTGNSRPADLGGTMGGSQGIYVGTTIIVGDITTSQITNGTAQSTNATTIKNNMINGFTATCAGGGTCTGNVLTVSAPAGDDYNGLPIQFVNGTSQAAVPGVRPTGLIRFTGSGTTSSSSNATIKKTLSSNTATIMVGATKLTGPYTIGKNKNAAQAASALAGAIGTGGSIKAYVGGNTITPTCQAEPVTTVCLVDNTTYSNGNAVTIGSTSNFGTLTVPSGANLVATAGGVAPITGWDNFAPALYGTAFSGGMRGVTSTGSNLSGGTNLVGTISATTTAMTNGSPTPVRSEVGLFKRTDIVATAANGNTYLDGMLVANGTAMNYPKAAGRTDCAGTSCTYAEELQNFANWYSYYRTRTLTMKTTGTLAFDTLNGLNYNVGYDNISNCDNNTACASSVVQGVGQFVDTCTGNCSTCSSSAPYTCTCGGTDSLGNPATGSCQRSTWWNAMTRSNPSSNTPLRKATAKIGRYYAAKLGAQTASPATQADPVQYSCQQNYLLLVTDGYWNENETASMISKLDGTDIGNQDNVATVGDQSNRPYYDGEMASTACSGTGMGGSSSKRTIASSCRTLADVTYYYYNTDLRSAALGNATNKQIPSRDVSENNVTTTTDDPRNTQHMTFFAMGLGIDGTLEYRPDYREANSGDYYDIVQGNRNWPAVMNLDPTAVDDLWHAAVNGHGKYFSARNPTSVSAGLAEALNSIQLRVGAAAAAATSNLMPTRTDHGAFVASYGTVEWWGDLQARNIDVDHGGAVSQPQNASPNECVNDSGCLWSAQKKLDAMTAGTGWSSLRHVYIAPTSGTSGSTLREFTYSNLTATEKSWFDPTSGISQYTHIHSAYPAKTAADLASSLVDFIRGDTGSEQDGSTGDQLWRNRTHVLGDIVNTQPVYVRGAAFTYDEATNPGYDDFIAAMADRQPVVYVSANDGMLHAFAAEDTADGAPATFTGGQEMWAFIPTETLKVVKELADTAYVHRYFVDGFITVGDVRVGSTWHTILVGGLGGGGKAYYALDITDPFNPKYLWEISSATAGFQNLGYTYGNVSINKLPSGDWAVLFSSGYNNGDGDTGNAVQNGGGYLYAVNPLTGAMLPGFPLATGSGTDSDPSNLGKINAWVDNLQQDNTATDIYGGDMNGDLWRFNLASGTVSRLAHLEGYDRPVSGTPTLRPQPITTKPEMTLIRDGASSYRVIYVGTGQYLSEDDKSNTNIQSFYAIKDASVPSGGWEPRTDTGTVNGVADTPLFQVRKLISSMSDGGSPPVITNITKTDANGNEVPARAVCAGPDSTIISKTVDGKQVPDRCEGEPVDSHGNKIEMDWSQYAGWYVDFPDSGERMNIDMNLSLGTLTFGTNVPVSSACTTGGYGWINYLDYKTGLNVAGTGLIVSEKISNALIVGINVVKLPDDTLAAIITTSDNKHGTVAPSFQPDVFLGQRSLWREFEPY